MIKIGYTEYVESSLIEETTAGEAAAKFRGVVGLAVANIKSSLGSSKLGRIAVVDATCNNKEEWDDGEVTLLFSLDQVGPKLKEMFENEVCFELFGRASSPVRGNDVGLRACEPAKCAVCREHIETEYTVEVFFSDKRDIEIATPKLIKVVVERKDTGKKWYWYVFEAQEEKLRQNA